MGLFAYAGITDLIDGYIARRWNLQTVVGTVIDPMADKTLMTILTVCLAIKGALPGTHPNFCSNQSTIRLNDLNKKNLTPLSMARNNYPRSRCPPRLLRNLLPLHLSPATQNLCSVLGLQLAVSRGTSHDDQ